MEILTKAYDAPPVNRREIYRYMGDRNPDEQVRELVEQCLKEALPKLTYKLCYCELTDVETEKLFEHAPDSYFEDLRSSVLFGATIGIAMDRLISRYSQISPVRGLVMEAIGSERIESLCDAFNEDVKHMAAMAGLNAKRRISPGYGSFSIERQRDIFHLLDCPRKIGLSLTESLMMTPAKSVTALIGITEEADCPEDEDGGKCAGCMSRNCSFRER